jgi:hypothetical protein
MVHIITSATARRNKPQLMSRRLRSPPTQKIAFLCLVVRVSSVVHMLSMYSIEELGGLWNKFTILNLNFQSIKNKKAETLNIIDSYNPDIIIDTEKWLNDSVHNSEIFPPNYGPSD